MWPERSTYRIGRGLRDGFRWFWKYSCWFLQQVSLSAYTCSLRELQPHPLPYSWLFYLSCSRCHKKGVSFAAQNAVSARKTKVSTTRTGNSSLNLITEEWVTTMPHGSTCVGLNGEQEPALPVRRTSESRQKQMGKGRHWSTTQVLSKWSISDDDRRVGKDIFRN